METKQLLLAQVGFLQDNYNNLVAAHSLAKDDWDKEILLKISTNLLQTIGNTMDIITKMK